MAGVGRLKPLLTKSERSVSLNDLERTIEQTQDVTSKNHLLNLVRRCPWQNDRSTNLPRLRYHHLTRECMTASLGGMFRGMLRILCLPFSGTLGPVRAITRTPRLRVRTRRSRALFPRRPRRSTTTRSRISWSGRGSTASRWPATSCTQRARQAASCVRRSASFSATRRWSSAS